MRKRFLWVFLVPAVALTAAVLAAGGAAGGGQHEETAGNCLSFPVIFGEGSLSLRGTSGPGIFEGDSRTVDGVTWYVQQDPDNLWQADSGQWGPESSNVSWVDWGDNLESQTWKTTSKVRVETVLFKDLTTAMSGYVMSWLEGTGKSELWGTNTFKYVSSQATIYSDHARLTIQRIDPNATLSWNPATGEWDGALSTDFNGGCWVPIDGPGGYSAEVNVSGKAIYGYNWDVRTTSGGIAGTYRITFSLDELEGTGTLRTNFMGAQVMLPVEGETLVALSGGGRGGGGKGGGGGAPAGGGTAVIDEANSLTYIDVEIKPGRR